MKKIRIIADEVFQTVVPLCTISTIKEGESGFIRKEDCIFYSKPGSKNQYLRIKINAPIYHNQDGIFMLFVSKIENEIEVNADPDAFYYLEIGFNENPELFTTETKIKHEEYFPYDSSRDISPKDKVDEILGESETLQDAHRNFVDYCYSSDADEQDMEKIAKLLPENMEIMFASTKLPVLYMFLEEVLVSSEYLHEKKERLSNKNNLNTTFDPDQMIPNYRILGEYLRNIESLLDTVITEKIGEDNDKVYLSKLSIDELIIRIEKAKTVEEKHRINEEIQKRVSQQKKFSETKRGGG